MNKLLAAIVASAFALSAVPGFAADAAKRDDLTQEQRADMRNRADQLTRARASGSERVNTAVARAPAAKRVHHPGKSRKISRHTR